MVQKAIEQSTKQFVEAFNRRDAAAVAALYTEDAKLLPPNSGMISGKRGIQAFWQRAMETSVGDIILETVDMGCAGDLTYEIGAYTLKIRAQGSQAVTDTGKYVVVRERQADGSWKWVADIWNSNLPPAQ
jgi:uncharacterized protein (TIGR02246 family)